MTDHSALVAKYAEIRDRITEGPAAYCNPEVAHADALWLILQLDETVEALVLMNGPADA